MTYHEFVTIARKNGFVVWDKSGIIEQLSTGKDGIWAQNPITNKRHRIIANKGKDGKLRDKWDYRPFDIEGKQISVGALFDGSKLKKQLTEDMVYECDAE